MMQMVTKLTIMKMVAKKVIMMQTVAKAEAFSGSSWINKGCAQWPWWPWWDDCELI